MTPKDPFLEGTFWDKFWRPIRSRTLLLTPDYHYRYRPKKVFSEKASAIARIKSEMRQKCVKMGLVLLGKEERSKMRQKCVKNARNTFGGEHLLDDTEFSLNCHYRFVYCRILQELKK